MICSICGSECVSKFNKENNIVFVCKNESCRNETVVKIKDDSEAKFKAHADKIKSSNKIHIIISNIKKIRLETGYDISQEDIGNYLNITNQRYGAIERCNNIPTIIKLVDLAIIFNSSLSDFYDIVYISKEQFDKLNSLSATSIENEILKIEVNPTYEKMEKEIASYEEKYDITEHRIYKNIDSPEIIKIKTKIQKLENDYTAYRKKTAAILKQKKVIDYYVWQQAKDIIGYVEDKPAPDKGPLTSSEKNLNIEK